MFIIMIIVFCVLFVGIVFGIIWTNIKERKDFNGGICPKCGTLLRHFDNDSHGAQGWTCDECDYTTWISWLKYKTKE